MSLLKRRIWVLGGVALAFLLLVPPVSAASSATVFRAKTDGYANGFAGDCPDTLPPAPLVCHEWVIELFKEGFAEQGSGGVAPPQTPWRLFLLRHTLTFAGGDVEPIESDAAVAFEQVTAVTFDQQHLSAVTLHAEDLSLDDGTTADIDATWTAVSDRELYGNDGPALNQFGLIHHLHTDCLTVNNQGHQKFRHARMSAVVNGVPYEYDGVASYIAYNHFVSVEAEPQHCG